MSEILNEVIKCSVVERQWIRTSLLAMRKSLIRKRDSEVNAGEIYQLRNRELSAIDVLLQRIP